MFKRQNTYKTKLNFEIKTYDIDIAGHVNNIVFIRWLEDLRIKLFNKILPLGDLLKSNCYPLVISTSIDYKKQVKLFDQCKGEMIFERCDHFIWVLKAVFSVNKSIAATASQKCVIVDLLSNKIQNPPKHIKELHVT